MSQFVIHKQIEEKKEKKLNEKSPTSIVIVHGLPQKDITFSKTWEGAPIFGET